MIYRLMEMTDYQNIYNLWMSCKNMGFNDKDDSYDGIKKLLDRNPNTCFVAICDNIIVGVILATNDGRRGFIHHLAVHDSYRRQGIASTLLDMALDALKNEGINKVALLCFKYNEAGNNFWESQGFTLRTDINYRNKALTELIRIDT